MCAYSICECHIHSIINYTPPDINVVVPATNGTRKIEFVKFNKWLFIVVCFPQIRNNPSTYKKPLTLTGSGSFTVARYGCYLLHLQCHVVFMRRASRSIRGPMGMAFSWRGCSLLTIPPVGRRSPPVEDPGLCDPPGEPGWLSW